MCREEQAQLFFQQYIYLISQLTNQMCPPQLKLPPSSMLLFLCVLISNIYSFPWGSPLETWRIWWQICPPKEKFELKKKLKILEHSWSSSGPCSAPVLCSVSCFLWCAECWASLCWYSNKEHDRPCVIPALPTHLSTMLRRPPLQIYAKQMDTAPSHTSPQFPSLSHTEGLPTPSSPKHSHNQTASSLRFPPFRDDLKPITLIEAPGHLKWLRQRALFCALTGQAEKTTKQTGHRTASEGWAVWCREIEGVCLGGECVGADEKSFSPWFMPLSRLGYESGMMLQRAALQIMLAHLKRADLCSLSGSHSIFFLLLPLPRAPLRSEKLVVIIDHRYCSNLLWKMN